MIFFQLMSMYDPKSYRTRTCPRFERNQLIQLKTHHLKNDNLPWKQLQLKAFAAKTSTS